MALINLNEINNVLYSNVGGNNVANVNVTQAVLLALFNACNNNIDARDDAVRIAANEMLTQPGIVFPARISANLLNAIVAHHLSDVAVDVMVYNNDVTQPAVGAVVAPAVAGGVALNGLTAASLSIMAGRANQVAMLNAIVAHTNSTVDVDGDVGANGLIGQISAVSLNTMAGRVDAAHANRLNYIVAHPTSDNVVFDTVLANANNNVLTAINLNRIATNPNINVNTLNAIAVHHKCDVNVDATILANPIVAGLTTASLAAIAARAANPAVLAQILAHANSGTISDVAVARNTNTGVAELTTLNARLPEEHLGHILNHPNATPAHKAAAGQRLVTSLQTGAKPASMLLQYGSAVKHLSSVQQLALVPHAHSLQNREFDGHLSQETRKEIGKLMLRK